MTETARRISVALAVDTVWVLLFVVIGRRSHDEGGSVIAGALSIAAPFLLALWFGWVTVQAHEAPTAATTGVLLWLTTAIGGLLLRRFVFDRGTAVPFIIVTSLFLLAGLVGWRVGARWRDNRVTPNP